MAGSARQGSLLVHGTCVALSGRGALLRGAPGSGKSDLALRFLSRFSSARDLTQAARLVSDDQVFLSRDDGVIAARPPGTIEGRLEVRGIGIVDIEHLEGSELAVIVDLVRAADVPRLPPEPLPVEEILGVEVPVLKLNPFELSAPEKLALALSHRL